MVNAETLIKTEFGQALRQEREARLRSLAWLSAETKVGLAHLEALEKGHFDALPGGVFRRGIVRAYVQAVGLEEDRWLPQFQQILDADPALQSDRSTQDAWEQLAENVRRGRKPSARADGRRWFGVAMLLLLVLVAAFAVWHFQIVPRQRNLESIPRDNS